MDHRKLLESFSPITQPALEQIVGFATFTFRSPRNHLHVVSQQCTFQMLNSEYALTSAHCLNYRNDQDTSFELFEAHVTYPKGKEIDITQIFQHPYYNHIESVQNKYAMYDVAVFKVPEFMSISQEVQFCVDASCAFCRYDNCNDVTPSLILVGHANGKSRPVKASLGNSRLRMIPTQLLNSNKDYGGDYSYMLYRGGFSGNVVQGGDSGGGLFYFDSTCVVLAAITEGRRERSVTAASIERFTSTALHLPWIYAKARSGYDKNACPIHFTEHLVYPSPCMRLAECKETDILANMQFYKELCTQQTRPFCTHDNPNVLRRIRFQFFIGPKVFSLAPIYFMRDTLNILSASDTSVQPLGSFDATTNDGSFTSTRILLYNYVARNDLLHVMNVMFVPPIFDDGCILICTLPLNLGAQTTRISSLDQGLSGSNCASIQMCFKTNGVLYSEYLLRVVLGDDIGHFFRISTSKVKVRIENTHDTLSVDIRDLQENPTPRLITLLEGATRFEWEDIPVQFISPCDTG